MGHYSARIPVADAGAVIPRMSPHARTSDTTRRPNGDAPATPTHPRQPVSRGSVAASSGRWGVLVAAHRREQGSPACSTRRSGNDRTVPHQPAHCEPYNIGRQRPARSTMVGNRGAGFPTSRTRTGIRSSPLVASSLACPQSSVLAGQPHLGWCMRRVCKHLRSTVLGTTVISNLHR